MSFYDYKSSRGLRGQPFYALLMAAFAEADSFNFDRLRTAFPDIEAEIQARYDAPGGLLVGERDPDTGLERRPDGLYDGDELVREC